MQQEDTLVFERRIASVKQQHFNVKRTALVFTETQLPSGESRAKRAEELEGSAPACPWAQAILHLACPACL